MEAVIIIPARYASSRFPAKPLAKILGKPMIQWVVERCARAEVGPVLVATDDARIAATVEQFGGKVAMTRADHANGTSRIAEVAASLDAPYIINIQGDEPAIDPRNIREVLNLLKADDQPEMATLAEPLSDPEWVRNPNIVKVVCAGNGNALYFSRAAIPALHQIEAIPQPSPYLKHVGIYGYRRDFLFRYNEHPPVLLEKLESLEQLRALDMGARIRVGISHFPSAGVDVPDDIARAERLLIALGEKA
ncbi:MAG: 3-deoxy-manno-octulosonate cytidylyltransferase [Acidobacteria bacterium]|nr:3-deoxy-manno-octulosonate cytidylyltransferase [Acidobacteriota bacterium]MCB9398617.1 3-deoxy-manno-octulosonate cytidylyltransferase [Acidobacteriota bacterium]